MASNQECHGFEVVTWNLFKPFSSVVRSIFAALRAKFITLELANLAPEGAVLISVSS